MFPGWNGLLSPRGLRSAALDGLVVVDRPPNVIETGIGRFVASRVLVRLPTWLAGAPGLVGPVSSCKAMFFGATAAFAAKHVKEALFLRLADVATHAA